MYSKKFKFVDEYDQWKLPELTNWFKQNENEPFQVETLLEIKQQLKEVKGHLDDVELTSWWRHTHFANRSGLIVPAVRRDYEPEMCTQVHLQVQGYEGLCCVRCAHRYNIYMPRDTYMYMGRGLCCVKRGYAV